MTSLYGAGRKTLGNGMPLNWESASQIVAFKQFRGGLRLDEPEEDIPDGYTHEAQDFDVDDSDRLVRMSGIEVIENFAPRNPQAIFTHAGLNGNTELVMMDSPYIGVKAGDAPTVWTDESLPLGKSWDACVHGDRFIFCNGNVDVYSRIFGSPVATPLGWDPAETVCSFAGRLIAGGGRIGGVDNPLGVKWTAADGDPLNVSGIGSGYELLLADVLEGDSIKKILAMSFDLMAIVLRKSVWIGSRTGDAYAPVYFSPKVATIGTVSKHTVKSGPGFVVFLSDGGVELFDGNSVQHLSAAIDSELLPIKYTSINSYGAVYSALTQEYRLFTPDCTWSYSFKKQRWLKSTARSTRAVTVFSPVTIDTTTAPAGWGLYWDGAWGSDLVLTNAVLGDIIYLRDSEIGRDSTEITSYFNVPQAPKWRMPALRVGPPTEQMTLNELWFQTQGAGTLRVSTYNEEGADKVANSGLVLDALRKSTKMNLTLTGRSPGLLIELLEGSPKISRINARVELRSEETAK